MDTRVCGAWWPMPSSAPSVLCLFVLVCASQHPVLSGEENSPVTVYTCSLRTIYVRSWVVVETAESLAGWPT